MPDQSVTNSRERILNQLAFQNVELERCLTKASAIKDEITRLEDELNRQEESLGNEAVCFNPIKIAQKKCDECGFYRGCVYRSKEDYGRFKL